MHMIRRIDELVVLLESYVLDGVDLSERRVSVALRLLDIALDNAPPPPDDDGGDEAPIDADDRICVGVSIAYCGLIPALPVRPGRLARRGDVPLRQIEPATGAHLKSDGTVTLSRKQAAADAGLSERQRVTALRVASIPEDEFEELVESDDPPTIPSRRLQRARMRLTVVGSHLPPRAVWTPRVFSAAAMPLSVVTPAERSSSMTGITLAAN
jgi:hypothetical protein